MIETKHIACLSNEQTSKLKRIENFSDSAAADGVFVRIAVEQRYECLWCCLYVQCSDCFDDCSIRLVDVIHIIATEVCQHELI